MPLTEFEKAKFEKLGIQFNLAVGIAGIFLSAWAIYYSDEKIFDAFSGMAMILIIRNACKMYKELKEIQKDGDMGSPNILDDFMIWENNTNTPAPK